MKPTTIQALQAWADFSTETLSLPLRAARQLFAQHGYHGTSIREIADAAGLSVPGLYHHYPSKQEILKDLVTQVMNRLLEHTNAADAASNGSAQDRFDKVIECMLRFHLERRDEAFVASTEMRSMEEPVRREHVAQRDRLQAILRQVVEQGVAENVFVCEFPADAARALSSLCVSVSSWYRPDGPLSQDDIVRRYRHFTRAMVGARSGARIPRAHSRAAIGNAG